MSTPVTSVLRPAGIIQERMAVPASIFTTAGWMTGTFHVPPIHAFGEWLDHTGDFFRLTDVRLPGESEPVPFFALQRHGVILVAPGIEISPPEDNRYPGAHLVRRDVVIVLPEGILRGTLAVMPQIRVSDFVAHWPAFLPVHDAILANRDPSRPPQTEPLPLVFINAPRIVGLSEAP
jgi:hypothetical protein